MTAAAILPPHVPSLPPTELRFIPLRLPAPLQEPVPPPAAPLTPLKRACAAPQKTACAQRSRGDGARSHTCCRGTMGMALRRRRATVARADASSPWREGKRIQSAHVHGVRPARRGAQMRGAACRALLLAAAAALAD
eukprot:TRINITY_DN6252_c0_g1_i1.p1 TRINITY_DN6252_c0_g1~~TRINITY_DN6252_c0_g1_i1.p1  ORF type:complete len:137 (-),score=20.50 TRINITY_DN6252_c0_g1_i1:421-831(-)